MKKIIPVLMIASLFIFGCKKDDDALASEAADEYVGTYNAKVLNDGNEVVQIWLRVLSH